MIPNGLIRLREIVLNRLVGARGTINRASYAPEIPLDLPAQLASALRALKSAAISKEGNQVDYAKLRQSPAFIAYQKLVAALPHFDPTTLPNREARLAFWINCYNGLVLHAVIALGVQKSVSERWFGLAFFRKAAYCIGGQRLSCEDIEHGILRANAGNPILAFLGQQFPSNDPRQAWVMRPMDVRIHFALNCASTSCPPIAVYEAANLDAQLHLAAQSFIHAEVRSMADKLELSRIFQWYRRDFGTENDLRAFLGHYLKDGVILVAIDKHPLVFRRYDWSLNQG